MKPRSRRPLLFAAGLAALLLATSAAFGFPWNIDMMWGRALRPFKHEMRLPPPGTLPVVGGNLGKDFGGAEPVNPGATRKTVAQGRELFGIYCAICHGADARGGGPVGRKFMVEPPTLRLFRPDSYIYEHIREGGPFMPPLSEMISAEEAWALVHYVQTLEPEEAE